MPWSTVSKAFLRFPKTLTTKCILLSSWANSSTCAAIKCFDSITCFYWLSRRYYKCLVVWESFFWWGNIFWRLLPLWQSGTFWRLSPFWSFLEVLKTLAESHCVKPLNKHPHKIIFFLFGRLFLSKRKYFYIILLLAILIKLPKMGS